MQATHEIKLEDIKLAIEQRKIEILSYQDNDERKSDAEVLETAISDTINDELRWEGDVLDWIGYFGVISVNEKLSEYPGTIHDALTILMTELFNEQFEGGHDAKY